jgi:predicted SnoaL-like aldol condensation-catalyzing enzyme
MPDPRVLLQRIFDEIINEGRLEMADELFAEDYVDHGPMGDIQGREAFNGLGFPATGKPFETVSANLGRLRDGQAVEHWSEQGMLPMLVQLDLLPLPTPPAP